MPLRDIPGQDRVKAQLAAALRSGAVSHAYVFEGPRGTGRKDTALALAQALHCESGEADACGVCADCRKVANGNHPDVLLIDPDGASVKLEQIRELQRRFAYKSDSEKPRVYIIEEAERLTAQAANALLKFLEEPGPGTVAILITDNIGRLLPTIRSRAQRLTFVPLAPETMEKTLLAEGHPAELVRCAVRLAPGLASARELIQLNGFAEIRNTVLQLAEESARSYAAAVVAAQAAAGKGESAERLEWLFEMFALWCKDMLMLQLQQEQAATVIIDRNERNVRRAVSKPPEHWVSVMEQALQAKRRLRSNANPQMVLERFLSAL